MAGQRKLGRPTDQRKALLRGLVTELFQNGKVTTLDHPRQGGRKIAENIITLAIDECDSTVTVEKTIKQREGPVRGNQVRQRFPSAGRTRRIMAMIYEAPIPAGKRRRRTTTWSGSRDPPPLMEKIFREIAPKYKKRAQDLDSGADTPAS
jgi:large subunit ribosomal protein L17